MYKFVQTSDFSPLSRIGDRHNNLKCATCLNLLQLIVTLSSTAVSNRLLLNARLTGLTPTHSTLDKYQLEAMERRRSERNLVLTPSCSLQQPDNSCRPEIASFFEIKRKLKPFFGLLGRSAATPLERELMSTDQTNPSQDAVRQAEDLLAEMQSLEGKRRVETRSLWDGINELWQELEDKHEPQLGFSVAHFGIYAALKSLRAELEKRKEEKSKQIIEYVELLRSELTRIWNQCLISDDDKLLFTAFYETDYNEVLLQVHKDELEKWKLYEEKNQELLRKAKKREELWIKLRELDARADDPSKFVNRGGALLKDQTTHGMIMKSLPKLEAELKRLATRFQVEHGRKARILAQDIHALIEGQWEEYRREKSMKKESTRAKVRQSVVAPSSNGQMGPLVPAPKSGKAEKRQPPTPTLPSAKRRCFTPVSNGHLYRS